MYPTIVLHFFFFFFHVFNELYFLLFSINFIIVAILYFVGKNALKNVGLNGKNKVIIRYYSFFGSLNEKECEKSDFKFSYKKTKIFREKVLKLKIGSEFTISKTVRIDFNEDLEGHMAKASL